MKDGTIPPEFSIVCPKCLKIMGSLAKFCNQCGAELPSPTEIVSEEERRTAKRQLCSPNGHLIQVAAANAKFCVQCGVAIGYTH
jgi:hypothetical protein